MTLPTPSVPADPPENGSCLQMATFCEVALYAYAASKERVNVKPLGSEHYWFWGLGKRGFCSLAKVKEGRWRIRSVYVLPEWRKQGIGAQMTDALLRYAFETLHAEEVEVLALNPDFYQKRGFEVIGKTGHGVSRLLRKR